MKFFTTFTVATLAALAIAAPVDVQERGKPGGGAVSSSAAPATSSGVSKECYNNACGGGYPWKRSEDEVKVEVAREVVEELEARAKPGGGSVSSSAAPAASSGVSKECYNNACGGGYPWKRSEDEVKVEVAREVVEELEARAKPGGGSVSSSAAPAASSGVSKECYNNACGGGYPWKRSEDEVKVEVAREVVEELEARAKPGGGSVSSSAAPAASSGVTKECYNNACGGGYPW